MPRRNHRFAWFAVITIALFAVGAAAVVGFAVLRHDLPGGRTVTAAARATSPASSTRVASVPAGALVTVRDLTSGASPAAQRGTLTPELSAALPPGRLFPAGTSFTPDAATWTRSGSYAHLTGTLQTPGAMPAQAEIGLVLRDGHWLVTFEENL